MEAQFWITIEQSNNFNSNIFCEYVTMRRATDCKLYWNGLDDICKIIRRNRYVL